MPNTIRGKWEEDEEESRSIWVRNAGQDEDDEIAMSDIEGGILRAKKVHAPTFETEIEENIKPTDGLSTEDRASFDEDQAGPNNTEDTLGRTIKRVFNDYFLSGRTGMKFRAVRTKEQFLVEWEDDEIGGFKPSWVKDVPDEWRTSFKEDLTRWDYEADAKKNQGLVQPKTFGTILYGENLRVRGKGKGGHGDTEMERFLVDWKEDILPDWKEKGDDVLTLERVKAYRDKEEDWEAKRRMRESKYI